jgi:hypothetical protein
MLLEPAIQVTPDKKSKEEKERKNDSGNIYGSEKNTTPHHTTPHHI